MVKPMRLVVRLWIVLAVAVGAYAHPQTQFYSSVLFTFPQFDENGVMTHVPQPISNAWATLETSSGGAKQVIHARMLHPGDAITSWWVVFNEPENCTDGVCGEDDVLQYPELAKVSLLLADGQVADANGEALFYDYLAKGDRDGAEFGPGLINTHRAEIHFVLRTHGRAIGAYIAEQLGSFGGGCGDRAPHADCREIQFAIFKQ